jgi:hypothetical protein
MGRFGAIFVGGVRIFFALADGGLAGHPSNASGKVSSRVGEEMRAV